jgi:hypothetical protein
MDILDEGIINLWTLFQKYNVRYIMVGGFATNLHGFSRTTADCDVWIEDNLTNRKNIRLALEELESNAFEWVERMEFVAGWSSINLHSGLELDIMTSLKGFPQERFENCYDGASIAEIFNLKIPFLHINQLIESKKASARPKDLIDVIELTRIKESREEK